MLWAVILACHAATTNFATLMVTRFFLGCTEASLSPGFTLITSLWYRTSEQPLRAGIWFCGNSLSLIFGNLIAVGILQIKSNLKAWQVSLLFSGLPGYPSPNNESVAIHHIRHNDFSLGRSHAHSPPRLTNNCKFSHRGGEVDCDRTAEGQSNGLQEHPH